MKTFTTRGDYKTSARLRGADKGTTTELEATVSAAGANRNPLDVLMRDSAGGEIFNPGTIDSFGHVIVGTVNNQVDVQFYRGLPATLVTVTTANGGTVTSSGGMATFAATVAASSSAKGVSLTETVYTAGAEMYCIFTAAFTGTGAGTSYQRIGLYDANNGFYIGKEANTFGVTVLTGGSPTQTPRASFSEDTLLGVAGSKFTRAGTVETLDLTKLNVWRIRFGWVGSAPVKFEVLSPDGNWVTFHTIKQPNLVAVPSIADADLPVTCDVNSGNGASAISILSNCWGAGTTQALARLDATLTDRSLVQTVRSVITGETTAGGGAYVNVKVNPSGALAVDSTQSTSPWIVKDQRAGTATRTTVADSASDVSLLASNANRLGATIANDSSAVLYIALGTTASATDYTARVVQYGYYEVPYGYTGAIRGIWASDPGDGAARITELTA